MDDEAAMDLGLQNIKNHWRCAAHVVDELKNLQNFLPTRAVFINKAHRNQNKNIKQDKHLSLGQNRDHEWEYAYFVNFYILIRWWKINKKKLQICQSLSKSLFIIFLFGVDQASMLNKTLYS